MKKVYDEKYISKCHRANVYVEGNRGMTHWYECDECGEPCDYEPANVKSGWVWIDSQKLAKIAEKYKRQAKLKKIKQILFYIAWSSVIFIILRLLAT